MRFALKTPPPRNTPSTDKGSPAQISPAQMRDLVCHWYEDVLSGTIADPSHSHPGGWDETDFDLTRLFSQDYVNHVVPAPAGGWKRGIAAAVQIIQMYRLSYPDLTIAIDEQMIAEDRVITRYTAQGTHTARPFLHMPATSKRYKVTGIAIDRIANGKIAESWGQWDMCALLTQMGMLPSGVQAID
jgi:predicted ester cyclase